MIQSAASAASAQGGCASSRLDHGLNFYVNRGGCASSRLIHEFSDCDLGASAATPTIHVAHLRFCTKSAALAAKGSYQ